MKGIIDLIDVEDIQKYIEDKENIKLNLRANLKDNCEKDGHKPHYDTGTDNHMMWCKYSASTLKTNDYEGGEFIFLDNNDNIIEVIEKEKHYNKTLIFDVSHKHKVNPHYNGDRIVNLYFWEKI